MCIRDRKEKIQFQEVRKGTREHLRVKAERHYLGEDDFFHLEGGVEVVFPRKQKGEDVIIRSDSLVYDREFNHFWTTGTARVQWADVEIKAGRIDYYAPQEVFTGKGEVEITTADWSVAAASFKLGVKSKKFECRGGVVLQLVDFMATNNPLIVRAQELVYDRRTKIGLCQGGVVLEHGASQGQAGQIEFKLGAKESFIKWLALQDGVKLQLRNEWNQKAASTLEDVSDWFFPESQEVEAGNIYMESFAQTKLIKIIKLTNKAITKFMSTNGRTSQVVGEKIEFLFTIIS